MAGWEDHEHDVQRIRNYTPRPIDVEIRRTFDGDVRFRSKLSPTLFDYHTVLLSTTVAAAKTVDLPFELVLARGYKAKQNNVTLEEAQ